MCYLSFKSLRLRGGHGLPAVIAARFNSRIATIFRACDLVNSRRLVRPPRLPMAARYWRGYVSAPPSFSWPVGRRSICPNNSMTGSMHLKRLMIQAEIERKLKFARRGAAATDALRRPSFQTRSPRRPPGRSRLKLARCPHSLAPTLVTLPLCR